MPASERQRLMLRNRLIEILGEQEADILMESLPPVYWHDLATKEDMKAAQDARDALEDRLRTEMNGKFVGFAANVHGEFANVHGEFANVRAEFANVRAEFANVHGEFANVRAEFANVYAEFKTLRAENREFRGEMALQFAKQTRIMVFTMLGLAVPILGAVLTVGLA